MRLIDADAIEYRAKNTDYAYALKVTIDDMPSIDFLEIIAAHEQIGYNNGFLDGYNYAKAEIKRKEAIRKLPI